METHPLIEGGSYDPVTMKAMRQAFDEAWAVVAGNFNHDSFQAARHRLAKALVSVASENDTDVHALKQRALEAMAFSYRDAPYNISG